MTYLFIKYVNKGVVSNLLIILVYYHGKCEWTECMSSVFSEYCFFFTICEISTSTREMSRFFYEITFRDESRKIKG